MPDDINVKPIVLANVTGTVLGSDLAFSRLTSSNSRESLRSNTSLGAENTTVLRVAHQMPSGKSSIQRSLCSIDQTFARVDTSSVIQRIDNLKVGVTITKDQYSTEAEALSAFITLSGHLLAGGGAGFKALWQGQQ